MMPFLKTRLGLACVAAFLLLMGVALHRVAARRAARETTHAVPVPAAAPTKVAKEGEAAGVAAAAVSGAAPTANAPKGWSGPVENAAYLESYVGLTKAAREDEDSRGNRIVRRRTVRTTDSVAPAAAEEATSPPASTRASLRLQGRPGGSSAAAVPGLRAEGGESAEDTSAEPKAERAGRAIPARVPRRFNPYGRVIKCELVFTLDSTNEQTPLVGLVMEPVYNNGLLVIPAGAELHGVARPDRVRDRLFSGTEWVLVFPREGDRPNGRQVNVRGVALERDDPQDTGLTWGLTDGSYGLEGAVIRSLDQAEIKRFLATFLAVGAVTLQERDGRGRGATSTLRNTPQNAALQGVATNLERYASAIAEEIEAHGVFIRVPAGHQFYFYPTQIIDADLAGISGDVATVK